MEDMHPCPPHKKRRGGVLAWLITTDTPSVRHCTKASKEKTGRSYTMLTKKCVGLWGKKPQKAQEAKSLWKMKAAKEAGEEYYDPMRKDNIRERNETRFALWEQHLKDPLVALDKALKWVENSYWRSRPE